LRIKRVSHLPNLSLSNGKGLLWSPRLVEKEEKPERRKHFSRTVRSNAKILVSQNLLPGQDTATVFNPNTTNYCQ
jgi:hypothetical protein